MKKPCTSGEIAIEAVGNILKARAEHPTGITFEWFIDGELVSCDDQIPLPEGSAKYVALRAKDTQGGFRSIICNRDCLS